VATGWLTMPPRGALAITVTCGGSWITSSCQPWERWPLVCWAARKSRIACWLRASEIIRPSELREARWSELDPERRQWRLQLLGDCAQGKRILALAGAGAGHHWRRSALSLPERAQQGQRGNGLTKPEPSGVPTEASHSQPRSQKSRPHPGPLLSARCRGRPSGPDGPTRGAQRLAAGAVGGVQPAGDSHEIESDRRMRMFTS
jgi:hypothetical protein